MPKTTILTTYKNAEGWHVFMSDDLPGLYVASRDLSVAYDDVARSIQLLLKLDEGLDCTVSPELPLQEFIAFAHGVSSDWDDVVKTNRRFVVSGIHA